MTDERSTEDTMSRAVLLAALPLIYGLLRDRRAKHRALAEEDDDE